VLCFVFLVVMLSELRLNVIMLILIILGVEAPSKVYPGRAKEN
jgi:hypothetical protein